jgi:hypothetical protein
VLKNPKSKTSKTAVSCPLATEGTFMTPIFFEDCEPYSYLVIDDWDLREPDHEPESDQLQDPDRHEPE